VAFPVALVGVGTLLCTLWGSGVIVSKALRLRLVALRNNWVSLFPGDRRQVGGRQLRRP